MRNFCVLGALLFSGCSSGGSGMPGVPEADFERAFTAGLDVAAAERCGAPVDAGLVRYNLVEDAKRRGLPAGQADKAGVAFDKTRAEYSQRLQADPSFCATGYTPVPERLALYQKGEF